MVSKGLNAWVTKLQQQNMPVLGSVITELNAVTGNNESNVNQLAEVILRDPNLTAYLQWFGLVGIVALVPLLALYFLINRVTLSATSELTRDKAAIIAQWIKEGAKIDAGLDANADLVKELENKWGVSAAAPVAIAAAGAPAGGARSAPRAAPIPPGCVARSRPASRRVDTTAPSFDSPGRAGPAPPARADFRCA